METRYQSIALCVAPITIVTLVSMFVLPRAEASESPESLRPNDTIFQNLIQQRLTAVAQGDVAAYRRLLADEFVQISDTGVRRTVDDMASFVASHSAAKLAYTDIRAEVHGDIALVESELIERDQYGTRELVTRYAVNDVYIHRDGRWLLLRHQDTVKAMTPDRQAPTADVLSDYPGIYQWWPGFAERVTLREGKLYVQDAREPPDGPAFALEAVSDETFYTPGATGFTFFARDRTGVVTHSVVQLKDGRVVETKKQQSATK